MKPYKTIAHIHSLKGNFDEITVIAEHYMFGHRIPNSYICEYKDIMCSVIINNFNSEYYADDLYGIVDIYEKEI